MHATDEKSISINTIMTPSVEVQTMGSASLDNIHEDLVSLQKDVQLIKHIISEDFELNNTTKKALKAARKRPLKTYTAQRDVEKEFLR